jgi:Fur family ferric uptake transcriptional regulator
MNAIFMQSSMRVRDRHVKLFANNSHLDIIEFMKQKRDLRELLRKSGYKATLPRLAILTLFEKSGNPLSAQEIINLLPKDFDQATAYRTLKSFQVKGLIRPIDLRHNHAHYELADSADHHHLICLRCGRIEDVEHCEVEAVHSAVIRNSKHFAEIKQHTLEFYGLCKSCAKKDNMASIATYKNAPL